MTMISSILLLINVLMGFLPSSIKVILITLGFPVLFLGVSKPHMQQAPQVQQAPHVHEPKAKQAVVDVNQAAAAQAVEVVVNMDGSYQLMGAQLTEAELSAKLKGMQKSSVHLKADSKVPEQRVKRAMSLCEKVGVNSVHFSKYSESP